MKIKLRTLMAGPGGTHQPGEELEVDAKTGAALIAGNHATEIVAPKKRRAETATARPGENAALPPTAEADAQRHLDRIATAQAGAALDAHAESQAALRTEIGILEGQLQTAEEGQGDDLRARLADLQAQIDSAE